MIRCTTPLTDCAPPAWLHPLAPNLSETQPKDWSIKMNKKERRLALATALQSAARDVVVVDGGIAAAAADGKTKSLVTALDRVGADPARKTLLVLGAADETVMRAGRNVARLAINTADAIKVYDVLNADTIVMERAAFDAVAAAHAAPSKAE